ncbi:unnamed protein product [Colletotrichum noveboracense]|uniref:Transmembrane protein n=3 Tax=Colletotrichum gloeosporioides species complex TaxID=2707338 RepID=A0A9W4WAZ0_9PEZI|nr:uncharacterized protein CGMCC3_g13931 [Colletotrichum fructicola]KAE9569923.1 hypothetical protein CGMCC3_g13931 [Colletotrichum fructicola]CAI0649378.1 unnamed protein product [Colletotrichum noveboracense]
MDDDTPDPEKHIRRRVHRAWLKGFANGICVTAATSCVVLVSWGPIENHIKKHRTQDNAAPAPDTNLSSTPTPFNNTISTNETSISVQATPRPLLMSISNVGSDSGCICEAGVGDGDVFISAGASEEWTRNNVLPWVAAWVAWQIIENA